jgi:pyruvate dehydrogenase E2 component (dihydrolipoamide acetyltransferase)
MIFICFQLLCIIVENEEDVAAFKDYKPTEADDQIPGGGAAEEPPPTPKTAPPAKTAPLAPTKVAPPSVPAPSPVSQVGRVSATPYAKTLAASKGVDLSVSFQ